MEKTITPCNKDGLAAFLTVLTHNNYTNRIIFF